MKRSLVVDYDRYSFSFQDGCFRNKCLKMIPIMNNPLLALYNFKDMLS